MKISFNSNDTMKRLYFIFSDQSNDWLVELVRDYMNSIKVRVNLNNVYQITNINNCQNFVSWLQEQEFNATFWSNKHSNNYFFLDWGFNIEDNCPKLIEYQLKRLYNG